jgi:hypothetical protein
MEPVALRELPDLPLTSVGEREAPRLDWASVRPRGRSQTSRSITLALPFGETPLDSDAGREFLQTRLAMFATVVFALGAFGFIAYQLVLTGLPDYDFSRLFWQNGTLFHLSATILPVFVWLATRRRSLPLRALFALDAGGILFVLAAYGGMAMVGARFNPQRVDLVMMLITLSLLCLRAVVIPSTWLHTLVVGVLGSVPAFALAVVNAPKLVIYGSRSSTVCTARWRKPRASGNTCSSRRSVKVEWAPCTRRATPSCGGRRQSSSCFQSEPAPKFWRASSGKCSSLRASPIPIR